jgi:hypothetical protein
MGKPEKGQGSAHKQIGAVKISTLPVPEGVNPRSVAFTQSGKLVLRYSDENGGGKLATVNVDGSEFRPFYEGGAGDNDNLLFADGKRIHQGETIVECTKVFEECDDAKVVPIEYPAPLNRDNPRVLNPGQEVIIAPDNKTQAWMVLLNDFTVAVLTGTLERKTNPDRYVLNDSRVVSTVEPYAPDPENDGAVIPVQPIINGEVKQFVHGGEGISVVGGKELVTADSSVIRLATAEVDQITYTPGYDETTIFSPDERLGMVMTTRFSPATDLGIFGLMPRPYPISLNVNLARYMYTHGVTGVRGDREGNIGPALIDIERSKTEPGYKGINLATDEDWVYRSPMEWAPNSKMGAWPELSQNGEGTRIRIFELPGYQPGEPVATVETPVMPGSTTDLDKVFDYQDLQADIDVMVYGKHSGYITFMQEKRFGGVFSTHEKCYYDFSDDGDAVYNGCEEMDAFLGGNSVYTADVELTGSKPGVMKLKATFGALGGPAVVTEPAQLIFDEDASGEPQTGGYVEYDGKRLTFEGITGE